MKNSEFFDELSIDYDEMINFENSLKNKTENLKNFISSDVNKVADIGCGSGIDSIALSNLGLKVTGFDASSKMILQSKKNSQRLGKEIDFFNYSGENIPNRFINEFDFICSLGNTIANISPESLPKTFRKFSEILRPNSTLLLHILNYEKKIATNERIVNINKAGSNYITRFYDFENNFIRFNILYFNGNNTRERKLISTKLYPHKPDYLLNELKKVGFNNFSFFGNFKKAQYDKNLSNDIYIFCKCSL